MPSLTINGQKVQVEDGFGSLSADEQNARVEQLARGFSGGGQQQPIVQPSLAPSSTLPVASPAAAGASSGIIWPVSKDAQGQRSFDSNAGLLGVAKRAVTLPYDVATGKIPATGPDDRTNPDLIQRGLDFASLASPVNPAIRAGSLAIPGASGARMVPSSSAPPTAQALKAAAGEGYDAARKSGVDIRSDSLANWASDLRSSLEQDGFLAKLAPKTHDVIGELINPPEGSVVSISGVEALRRGLSRITGDPTDKEAARVARRGLDNFLETNNPENFVVGPSATKTPEEVSALLRDARGNYASAKRSNTLTGDLDQATTGILERAEGRAQAANSGRNLDNAIRQRVQSLLENPKKLAGFSNDEIDALKGVVQGSFGQNRIRDTGNLLGGGNGLGALVAGGIGGIAGGSFGGTTGAMVGMGLPVAGAGAKMLENALAKRGLTKVDETVRQNSPLSREMLAQQILQNPAMTRDRAVLQSVLPGMLRSGQEFSPPQQQPRMPFALGPPWI